MKLSYIVLYVDDVSETAFFYEKAFGLVHKFTHESGDYAEMDTGETVLAFAAHALAGSILNKPYEKAKDGLLGSQITLEPKDVKEAFNLAVANGAEVLAAPEVKPWNFEVAMLKDCNGHIVELAKAL